MSGETNTLAKPNPSPTPGAARSPGVQNFPGVTTGTLLGDDLLTPEVAQQAAGYDPKTGNSGLAGTNVTKSATSTGNSGPTGKSVTVNGMLLEDPEPNAATATGSNSAPRYVPLPTTVRAAHPGKELPKWKQGGGGVEPDPEPKQVLDPAKLPPGSKIVINADGTKEVWIPKDLSDAQKYRLQTEAAVARGSYESAEARAIRKAGEVERAPLYNQERTLKQDSRTEQAWQDNQRAAERYSIESDTDVWNARARNQAARNRYYHVRGYSLRGE
jgi:hypothetical protein